MILNATTRKLQVVLGEAKTTNDCPIVADYYDSGVTPAGAPALVNSNGVTAVDVVPAPASGYTRIINGFTFWNADTVSHGVIVRYNDNGTTYNVIKVTLLTGETLQWNKTNGWQTLDANGNIKQSLSGTTANLTDVTSGSWTPADASGAGLTLTSVDGHWNKIGPMVFAEFFFAFPSTASSADCLISGLPFVSANRSSASQGFVSYGGSSSILNLRTIQNAATGIFVKGALTAKNSDLSGLFLIGTFVYPTV